MDFHRYQCKVCGQTFSMSSRNGIWPCGHGDQDAASDSKMREQATVMLNVMQTMNQAATLQLSQLMVSWWGNLSHEQRAEINVALVDGLKAYIRNEQFVVGNMARDVLEHVSTDSEVVRGVVNDEYIKKAIITEARKSIDGALNYGPLQKRIEETVKPRMAEKFEAFFSDVEAVVAATIPDFKQEVERLAARMAASGRDAMLARISQRLKEALESTDVPEDTGH